MLEILKPGIQTTVQDSGRPGYLAKGIPPAGVQDNLSYAMASVLVGNSVPPAPLSFGNLGEAALEMLISGPTIRFHQAAVIALTGGEMHATLDGEIVPQWTRLAVAAGMELVCGKIGPGMRAYLGCCWRD